MSARRREIPALPYTPAADRRPRHGLPRPRYVGITGRGWAWIGAVLFSGAAWVGLVLIIRAIAMAVG